MSTKRIAIIPGDGIGHEVVPEGVRVLEAVASVFNLPLKLDYFDFACWPYFEKHGRMLPDNWRDVLSGYDAIFFWCCRLARKNP